MASLLSITIVFSCLSLFFVSSDTRNFFTIKRKATNSNNFDLFKVPQSNCTDSGSQCKHFHKEAFSRLEPCTCSCPFLFSTFSFIGNPSWGCMENKEVRSRTGCRLQFEGEQLTSPFKVLEIDSQNAFVTLKDSRCNIDYGSSKYLTCSGSWSRLDSTINNKHISTVTENMGERTKYIIVIHGQSSPLLGTFLSLSFKCPDQQPSCVLFKIAGDIQCNVNAHVPQSTATAITPVTNTPTGKVNNKVPGQDNNKRNKSDNSSGIIAAVVTIILLGLLVVIIVGYIYWKKRRGENVWLLDRCSYLAGKIKLPKSRSSTNKKQQHYEYDDYCDDENAYEEIPEVPRIAFVEGQTTAPKQAGFHVMSSSGQPDSGQEVETSMRRGRRSLTDDMGYVVPVDFEESEGRGWNTKNTSPQNGTLDHTRGQEEICDSESYTTPETDLSRTDENTDKPFMVTQTGKSYHFADDDGYAEPNVDLPEYHVLEEGGNKDNSEDAELHLEGTNNNAHDQTGPDFPEHEEKMRTERKNERGDRKKASFRDNTFPVNKHSGRDEDGYETPETDLSETTTGGGQSQQNRQDPEDHMDKRQYQNADIQLPNESNNANPANPQYVNKKTRRRPPSPPRGHNNSVHYV